MRDFAARPRSCLPHFCPYSTGLASVAWCPAQRQGKMGNVVFHTPMQKKRSDGHGHCVHHGHGHRHCCGCPPAGRSHPPLCGSVSSNRFFPPFFLMRKIHINELAKGHRATPGVGRRRSEHRAWENESSVGKPGRKSRSRACGRPQSHRAVNCSCLSPAPAPLSGGCELSPREGGALSFCFERAGSGVCIVLRGPAGSMGSPAFPCHCPRPHFCRGAWHF